ncbi:MAG: DUF2871 family protein [Bullifex sp.]
MEKKMFKSSFVYLILALCAGVFFREYTKIVGFTGLTSLSFMHAHYFIMGFLTFLVLGLLAGKFAAYPRVQVILLHTGLNITELGFLLRGLDDIHTLPLPSAAISGIAGIGHILIGVSLVWVMAKLLKQK